MKNKFPRSRKSLLPRDLRPLLSCPNLIVPEIEMHETHLDPSFSIQGVLFATIKLVDRFHLNFVEIVSLLCSLDYTSNNTYYWLATAWLWAKYPLRTTRGSNDVYGQGIHFGWNFLNDVRKMHLRSDESGVVLLNHNNRYTPRDYNATAYTWDEFLELFTRRVIIILYSYRHFSTRPNQSTAEQQFAQVLELFLEKSKQNGDLMGGNILNCFCYLGLLPSWFIGERKLPKNSHRNVITIANHGELLDEGIKSPSVPQATTILECVRKGVEGALKKPIDNNDLEHVTCKIARNICKDSANGRNRYVCWLLRKQSTFSFNLFEGRFRINCSNDEKSIPIEQPAIFHKWISVPPGDNNGSNDDLSLPLLDILMSPTFTMHIPPQIPWNTANKYDCFEKTVDKILYPLQARSHPYDGTILLDSNDYHEKMLMELNQLVPIFPFDYVDHLHDTGTSTEEVVKLFHENRETQIDDDISKICIKQWTVPIASIPVKAEEV